MTEAVIKDILTKSRSIAVVGLSKDSSKQSYRVAAYLQEQGYRIIPVNPTVDEVLGEKSYSNLLDIPEEIQRTLDIVDIFRRIPDVMPIVEQAIKLKRRIGRPYVIWMQLGIVNEPAAQAARSAGLIVIMDRCMMLEHHCLLGHLDCAK